MDSPQWLTREEIDRVVDNLSADDLITSGIVYGDPSTAVQSGANAFNAAAERLGLSNGTVATARMHASDLQYFASALRRMTDVDGPKSEDTDPLPTSVTSGE